VTTVSLRTFINLVLSGLAVWVLWSMVTGAPRTAANDPFVWRASHNRGDFREYSWSHSSTAQGTFGVVMDPTDDSGGMVYRGVITGARPDSHRLYPLVEFSPCIRGGYRSSFRVWADFPPAEGRGWVSFATYANGDKWQDLFGVNLGSVDGQDRLVLFHVPRMGKGDSVVDKAVPFPLRRWVQVDVDVDETGIRLFQDGIQIAHAEKAWGPDGVRLCAAHWGLYAEGKNRQGVIMNDRISIVARNQRQGDIMVKKL